MWNSGLAQRDRAASSPPGTVGHTLQVPWDTRLQRSRRRPLVSFPAVWLHLLLFSVPSWGKVKPWLGRSPSKLWAALNLENLMALLN